jgi:hypothetical protein
MSVNLDQCTLITSEEYINLNDPIFVGQTRLDDNNMYYMVFQVGDVLYKIHNQL